VAIALGMESAHSAVPIASPVAFRVSLESLHAMVIVKRRVEHGRWGSSEAVSRVVFGLPKGVALWH
jgi:hypothetical protein